MDVQCRMLDERDRRASESRTNVSLRTAVREQERSCPCTDPLLRFPAGILPHRCIYQANRDFPRGEVCQEREFRTDSLLLRSSSARPLEEAKQLPSPLVACRWVEPDHSDRTVVAAAGIPRYERPDNSRPAVGRLEVAALRCMKRQRRP
jgi:hypothetical protein